MEQRADLEEVFRDAASAAVRKRAQIVLLKADDSRIAGEVAGIVKCCAMTVNNRLERYSLEGTSGLYTKEGRGRKPILRQEQDKPLVTTTTIAEHRQSLKAAHAALLEESGKEFSAQTLRRFLKVLATVTKDSANTSASSLRKKR